MKNLPLSVSEVVAAIGTSAFAYTITGMVGDDAGNVLGGVSVTLVKENKSTLTDAFGKYIITGEETTGEEGTAAFHAVASVPGFVSVNSGVLSYRQSGSAPVQVRTFDAMGNQVFSKTLYGSGELDLRTGIRAKGNYFAKVTMGSARQDFRFFADGRTVRQHNSEGMSLMKNAQAGETLRFEADGYKTRVVPLGTLDTMVNVNLERTSGEQTFAFGYAMGNAPTPSKGCGKNSTLQQNGANSNAKKYGIRIGDYDRAFWMTLPQNYSNNKPYKILFAMHCMGSNAEDFTQHAPDYDHPSPYYGQQNLDTENNYIFVSPESRPISGNGEFGPWHQNDNEDHRFFGEMLTLIEENYCIDTSRVFVTGFSFGAMFTNSLSWEFQDRIRAVAVYATAAYNIYLPPKKNLPIAWMGVHGKGDETCPYKNDWGTGARDSALVQILRFNSAEGKDAVNEKMTKLQEIGDNIKGHVCYDFEDVDPRFPVKWCSWNGPHRWPAHDAEDFSNYYSNSWTNSWVPKTVHEFFEQF